MYEQLNTQKWYLNSHKQRRDWPTGEFDKSQIQVQDEVLLLLRDNQSQELEGLFLFIYFGVG